LREKGRPAAGPDGRTSLFAQIPGGRRRADFGAEASRAARRVGAELAGAENALVAARTLTAWVAGFVVMELNGGFQLGGDVHDAWEFGAERVVAALTAPPRP
jgi:hypothetical protein